MNTEAEKETGAQLLAEAEEADRLYSAVLKMTYGKRAGDFRYKPDSQSPECRAAGEAFRAANSRWHAWVDRNRGKVCATEKTGWEPPTELRHGATVLAARRIADLWGYELAYWSGWRWVSAVTGARLEPQPEFVARLPPLPDGETGAG